MFASSERQPFFQRAQRRPVAHMISLMPLAGELFRDRLVAPRLHRQQQRAPPAQDRRAGVGDMRRDPFLPVPGPQGDAEGSPVSGTGGRFQQQGRVRRHFHRQARHADLAQQVSRSRVTHGGGVQTIGNRTDQAARAGQAERANALRDEHGLPAQHLRHPHDAQIVKDAVRRGHILQEAAAAGQHQVRSPDLPQQRAGLVAVGGGDAVRGLRLPWTAGQGDDLQFPGGPGLPGTRRPAQPEQLSSPALP